MRLFISYSHRDTETVIHSGESLVAILRSADHDARYDKGVLKGGFRWRERLIREIKSSNVVIFAATPNSVASEWCRRELKIAKQNRKPILPIILTSNAPYLDILADIEHVDISGGSGTAIARISAGLQAIEDARLRRNRQRIVAIIVAVVSICVVIATLRFSPSIVAWVTTTLFAAPPERSIAIALPSDCIKTDQQRGEIFAGQNYQRIGADQPIPDSTSAREMAQKNRYRLLAWGQCKPGDLVQFNLEMFPNSRQYGVIELDSLTFTVPIHNLKRAGNIIGNVDKYLRYEGDTYEKIAAAFRVFQDEAKPSSVQPTPQKMGDCVNVTSASNDPALQEWAEMAFMHANSLLFAEKYLDAIQVYDLARLSPALNSRARNNRGVAGMNAAFQSYLDNNIQTIAPAYNEAACDFEEVVKNVSNTSNPGAAQVASIGAANRGNSYANMLIVVQLFDPTQSGPFPPDFPVKNDTEKAREQAGIDLCSVDSSQSVRSSLTDLCLGIVYLQPVVIGAVPEDAKKAKRLQEAQKYLNSFESSISQDRPYVFIFWRGYLAFEMATRPGEQNAEKTRADGLAAVADYACPAGARPIRLASDRLLLKILPRGTPCR